jgi:hypothetical protein
MNDDIKNTGESENDGSKNQEPLKVHNPFKKDDDKQITQEDIDNEQKFKEAMSERD